MNIMQTGGNTTIIAKITKTLIQEVMIMEVQQVLEKNRTMHDMMRRATVDALDMQQAAEQLHSLLQCGVYMIDKDGNPVKLKFVGNHGDCSSDSDYAEYRYVPGGTEGSTELHTCGGHIRITHLCRGRTYTIREESVPENSVFVREATDTTPIEKEYKIACSENDSPSSRSETHLIVDKQTRVTFEKKDAKYNYLIPDEKTTFEDGEDGIIELEITNKSPLFVDLL